MRLQTLPPVHDGFAKMRRMKNSELLPPPAPPSAAATDILDASCCAWMRAIAAQDENALAALYDATIARVYGLALRITGKAEAAEEVSADVYLQVWRNASAYNAARGRVLTWILTICYSRALDHLRRRDGAESHPEPELLRPDLQETVASPLELLQAVERDSKVYVALQQLSPIQRQLIALAFFKGLSHQEAAEHCGLPLGTVKTHIRRALEQLREILGTADREADQ